MSYTPINWQNGDTITAEKMNKMDNGWSVGETQILSETVTTTLGEFPFAYGEFVYAEKITDDSIVVMFDNTSYTVEQNEYGYGEVGPSGPIFTTYPFFIATESDGNILYTENAGTYSVAVSAVSTEVSESFASAVNKCIGSLLPFKCIVGSSTIQEMSEASSNGRLLYFKPYGDEGTETCIIGSFSNYGITFVPTISGVTAGFDNSGVFIITITN